MINHISFIILQWNFLKEFVVGVDFGYIVLYKLKYAKARSKKKLITFSLFKQFGLSKNQQRCLNNKKICKLSAKAAYIQWQQGSPYLSGSSYSNKQQAFCLII